MQECGPGMEDRLLLGADFSHAVVSSVYGNCIVVETKPGSPESTTFSKTA